MVHHRPSYVHGRPSCVHQRTPYVHFRTPLNLVMKTLNNTVLHPVVYICFYFDLYKYLLDKLFACATLLLCSLRSHSVFGCEALAVSDCSCSHPGYLCLRGVKKKEFTTSLPFFLLSLLICRNNWICDVNDIVEKESLILIAWLIVICRLQSGCPLVSLGRGWVAESGLQSGLNPAAGDKRTCKRNSLTSVAFRIFLQFLIA